MGACKDQMMQERDQFWITLQTKIKNTDSLQEFLDSAQELFYLCESSGALYESSGISEPDIQEFLDSAQELLFGGAYQELLKESWHLYHEERASKTSDTFTYEREN